MTAKWELSLQFRINWDCAFSGKVQGKGEKGWETQEMVRGAEDERKAQELVFFPKDKSLLCSLPDTHVYGRSRKH